VAAARPDPPLDDRRWIVLPFTNVARAADLDWLSAASVNLLTLDLSRWSDIRVVDVERVADLLRDVPEAGRTQLGLQTGLATAKRAGAGKLVMGEFRKQGAGITVHARVFDARTGERVRTVSEVAQTADSVAAAYQRLAPEVVNVPTPIGATQAGIGSSSSDAIRSYTLGLAAFNRGRTDSAGLYFLEAIRSDSSFALAYRGLADVLPRTDLGRLYPAGAAQARAAAARLAAGLPERERLVIAPGLTACERGARLLALDSADAEGWLAIGNCYRDNTRVIVSTNGEGRREVSLDAARQAYERVLALQPSREAIIRLQVWRHPPMLLGCTLTTARCPAENSYWAALVYDGDTLSTRFERVRRFDPPARRRELAAGRRAKLVAGRAFFAQWTAAHPEDITAHAEYGDMLTQLGDFAGAQREFDAGSELARLVRDPNRPIYSGYRAEVHWKLGQADRAAAILDSIAGPGPWPHYNTAFGLFSRGVGSRDTARRSLSTAFNSVYAGVVPAGFDRTMRAYAAADTANRRDILEVGTTLAFHALRTRSAADTASEFSLFRFQAFLALADSVRARRALAEYDAWGNDKADDYWDAYEMFAAESHLEIGDTATAWARIEPFASRWPGYDTNSSWFWDFPGDDRTSNVRAGGTVLGRAWLLYADLAMATGHREEARRGYAMIVGMWEKGEGPVQPLVKRAKEALAKLGS
jgi:tetratricopeptide (TPR) repeat protein/TolB-like protein